MIADLLFCALLVIAAVSDLRTRMIENWTILGVLVLALGKLAFNSAELASHALAFLTAIPLVLLWLRGGLGGGDVKLIVAVLCYIGLARMLPFWALFMVGLLVLAVLCAIRNKRTMPLAPAIACAGIGALWASHLF